MVINATDDTWKNVMKNRTSEVGSQDTHTGLAITEQCTALYVMGSPPTEISLPRCVMLPCCKCLTQSSVSIEYALTAEGHEATLIELGACLTSKTFLLSKFRYKIGLFCHGVGSQKLSIEDSPLPENFFLPQCDLISKSGPSTSTGVAICRVKNLNPGPFPREGSAWNLNDSFLATIRSTTNTFGPKWSTSFRLTLQYTHTNQQINRQTVMNTHSPDCWGKWTHIGIDWL